MERRTFYAKVGKSQDVVKVGQQFIQNASQGSQSPQQVRVLTDITGKTDRVIVELVYKSAADWEEANKNMPGDATDASVQGLMQLIDGAEVELLNLEYSS
ncbi:MAG: hypothetical protein ACRDFS_06615, partial [Chloroflexota bacterium]